MRLLIFLAALLAAGSAVAAEVVPAVVEPSPIESIMDGLLLIIGGAFLWMIRTTVAMLPTLIQEWIDTKRQRDLHSAVMSKVAELMKAGRWPTPDDVKAVGGDLAEALKPGTLDEIRNYINEFNPAAGRWAKLDQWTARGDALLKTLAARKAAELTRAKAPDLSEELRKILGPDVDVRG